LLSCVFVLSVALSGVLLRLLVFHGDPGGLGDDSSVQILLEVRLRVVGEGRSRGGGCGGGGGGGGRRVVGNDSEKARSDFESELVDVAAMALNFLSDERIRVSLSQQLGDESSASGDDLFVDGGGGRLFDRLECFPLGREERWVLRGGELHACLDDDGDGARKFDEIGCLGAADPELRQLVSLLADLLVKSEEPTDGVSVEGLDDGKVDVCSYERLKRWFGGNDWSARTLLAKRRSGRRLGLRLGRHGEAACGASCVNECERSVRSGDDCV